MVELSKIEDIAKSEQLEERLNDLSDFANLIEKTIETECYEQDFMSRVNVANVILNRYWDGSFGKSIEEIITSPNQFCYGRTEITTPPIDKDYDISNGKKLNVVFGNSTNMINLSYEIICVVVVCRR